MSDKPTPDAAHGSDAPAHFADRFARRYAEVTGSHPWKTLGIFAILVGLCGWYGSGIQIRSNMEDLFPDSTPAVVAAKNARDTLKSISQMIIVFGSPDKEANHRLAEDFCAEAAKWPDVAGVECRRDIDFFRHNAALFMAEKDLLDVEKDVQDAVKRATEKELVDDALTEGLDDAPTPTQAGDVTPTSAPGKDNPAAGQNPAVAQAGDAGAGNKGAVAGADAASPTTAEAGKRFKIPSDQDLQKRFSADDIRQWNENPTGTVVGVKLFPTIAPQQVDEAAKFVAKVNAKLQELKPQSYNAKMTIATSGDYSEMSEEIDTLKRGLYITSAAALLIIALIQVAHFRRFRALVLMSIPLLAGTALTLAFARGTVGYLNMITAFIFSMLFGMGNDFNVYTLSRYLEERAAGHDPLRAVANMMAGMWGALGQAAATTSVAFFALVVLEFRGFSQFGLIAGVGVFLSLMATLALFPPLVMAMHRLSPDRHVSEKQAEGQRWLGWFAEPSVAKITLIGFTILTVVSVFAARGLEFETNLRKLRTPPSKAHSQMAQSEARQLETAYRTTAEQRPSSPILVVTDNIDDAAVVAKQLQDNKDKWTRVRNFVSIHTFVPADQDKKLAIIARIRATLDAKHGALTGQDRIDADRALELLQAKAFGPMDLPGFVRDRFKDRKNQVGRFVLVYANGNLADARSVQEVIDQVGIFHVGPKMYRSTASFFILAEADSIVRKEGPIAVILATLAVAVVVLWYFRSWWLLLYSFVPLLMSFAVFLGVARALNLELNLFSVTTLPGVVGIGIDGVTHILHRWWEEGERADLKLILQQVGGAAWFALITTCVGFAALLFQDNPGLQQIAWWASIGLLVSCLVSNILVAGMLVVIPPPRRGKPKV